MPAGAARRALALAVVLVVALAVNSLASAMSASSPGRTAEVAPWTAASSGACAGALLDHDYNGSVGIENSTFIPVMPLNYSYMAEVASSVNGGLPYAYACVEQTGSVRPAPSGAFNFSVLPTPVPVCTSLPDGTEFCNTTTGPYVGLNLTAAPPYPTGLEPLVTRNGSDFRVEYYRDLAAVTLTPSSLPGPVSAGATEPFRALPVSALGSPSPVAPSYQWTIDGTGWSVRSAPNGSVANVTSTATAGPGTLSVVASLATASGMAITPPASVSLLAVPTTIVSGVLDRTAVDEGQPVAFAVNGTGAPGYNYTATLEPGLGLPSARGDCTATTSVGEPTALSCGIEYAYAASGVAEPALLLSNGASTATYLFPNVTVERSPVVEFTAGSVAGYVGAVVALEVAGENGTGTTPYGLACLTNGTGPVTCQRGPGPAWTFATMYDRVGTYLARAWILDAAGVNASASTDVRISNHLSVVLVAPGGPVAGGSATSLSATIDGGALPARAWWNVTGAAAPFAVENVSTDGTLSATFLPLGPGPVTVTLSVVDGLGSREVANETFTVSAGPATAIVPAVVSPLPADVAGVAFPVAWQAQDAEGQAVPTFSSAAEVTLVLAGTGADVPGWVNASEVGPLSSPLPGWFDVPPTAWSNGSLDLTVAATLAGAVEVGLTLANGDPLSAPSVTATVMPDVDHLRLLDPSVALASARSGATLWRVSDRFGNPAPGAEIVVTESFDGSTTATLSPVTIGADGATVAWVNFTAPGSVAGTVTVRDLAGDLLLPPIAVPAGAPGFPIGLPLAVLVPASAVAVVTGTMRRARRRATPVPTGATEVDLELRRLAEGRAMAVDIVRAAGSIDLEGLAARWGPGPAPADLPDWVASLLTDGTLGATFGDDGVARFCVTPEREVPPQVTVDLEAFDRAQLRRDEATLDDEP
jgi:hypothetical protein